MNVCVAPSVRPAMQKALQSERSRCLAGSGHGLSSLELGNLQFGHVVIFWTAAACCTTSSVLPELELFFRRNAEKL